MVFKRVLKGIGRLMLTTAVMCGVGLFLCSSEVKADIGIELTVSSGDFTVTATGNDSELNIYIKGVELYNSETSEQPLYKIDGITADSPSYTVNKSDFIKGDGFKTSNSSIAGGAPVGIQKVVAIVNYKDKNSIDRTGVRAQKIITPAVNSDTIYKVSAEKASSYIGVAHTPSFKYTVGGRENCQYGYSGETYKIEDVNTNVNYYYMLAKLYNGGNIEFEASDSNWKDCSTDSLITPTTPLPTIDSANVIYKVAYLPKVNKLVVTGSSNSGSTLSSTELEIITNSENADTTLTYGIGSFGIGSSTNPQEDQNDTILGYYEKAASISEKSGMGVISATPSVSNKCNVTMQLNNISTTGTCKLKIAIKLGTSGANPIEVASVELPITLSAVQATDFKLKNDSISVMAGSIKEVELIEGFLPANASQSLSDYVITVVEETASSLKTEGLTVDSNGIIKIAPKDTVTSGTTKLKVTVKDRASSTTFDSKYITVNIVSFDKDKTISSIKNSNKNYITYNKDKGYSLDIKQLIIDNAKDTSDNTVKITKDQITDVSVGGSSCTDGIWKPSEAALNQKVSCKINCVKIEESDGLKVSAYPMPTATYSSSNRTLSVKIPTKVATAYSDDNNIRQSKGFKLILEDSSGNTLYEYTDSKYQNVLSSSSESTVTYTVPAADIEGMVTSAASNGKFSADTTSVKFKVIPMGYKQSSTSDETIKAKDEIAGKTDAVTVYKVSASGTNFTSSAAYGLDGQTVSITATPNSGYSFKQWSDGNTSNPRQVKVSASGTRAFQAVAGDRVANSTGAGGTDNSELYDDVPKTAESNSAIWLIVFMVFAVMGTTYALYLQLKAANSKHDR